MKKRCESLFIFRNLSPGISFEKVLKYNIFYNYIANILAPFNIIFTK